MLKESRGRRYYPVQQIPHLFVQCLALELNEIESFRRAGEETSRILTEVKAKVEQFFVGSV